MSDEKPLRKHSLAREHILRAVEAVPEDMRKANREINTEASSRFGDKLRNTPAARAIEAAANSPALQVARRAATQETGASRLLAAEAEIRRVKRQAEANEVARAVELVELQRDRAQRDRDRDAKDAIRERVDAFRWRVTVAVAIFAVLVAIAFGVLATVA